MKYKFKPNNDCSIDKYQVQSPAGVWNVEECNQGLHWVKLGPEQSKDIYTDVDVKAVEDIKLKTPLINWMKVYFEDAEKVRRYPLPTVCPQVFQKDGFREKVWREIYHNLSFGEIATYGDVAKRCGSEKASQVTLYFLLCNIMSLCQAVGTAMRTNPISLVIPCHRVVKAGGSPGHYSGGNRDYLKIWLLKHEENHLIRD